MRYTIKPSAIAQTHNAPLPKRIKRLDGRGQRARLTCPRTRRTQGADGRPLLATLSPGLVRLVSFQGILEPSLDISDMSIDPIGDGGKHNTPARVGLSLLHGDFPSDASGAEQKQVQRLAFPFFAHTYVLLIV